MIMDVSRLLPWDAERYSESESRRIIDNYEQLGFSGLLKDVSTCTRCKSLESHKRPYNILANDLARMGPTTDDRYAGLTERCSGLARFLEALSARTRGSPLSDEDLARELYESLFKRTWNMFGGYGEGLSIGLNPWTDYSLSKWNDQRKRCGILVVEKDWFPLNATMEVRSIFDFRYHEGVRSKRSHTYSNFWNKLRLVHPLPGFDDYITYSREMISRFNIVFTNSMACVKHGEERSGDDAVIMRCAQNCAAFTMRQIELLRPEIILPMGEHAQSSILGLFETRWTPSSRMILDRLRSSRFGLRLNNRRRNALSDEYDKDGNFLGLEAMLPGGERTLVIPLFHTNIYSNRWINDYKLLTRAIQRLPM